MDSICRVLHICIYKYKYKCKYKYIYICIYVHSYYEQFFLKQKLPANPPKAAAANNNSNNKSITNKNAKSPNSSSSHKSLSSAQRLRLRQRERQRTLSSCFSSLSQITRNPFVRVNALEKYKKKIKIRNRNKKWNESVPKAGQRNTEKEII